MGDIAQLRRSGVPVVTDCSKKLHMHHKFAIIDGQILLNGSFNWTPAAVKGSNENLVASHSMKLAQSFTMEFERLWCAFKSGDPGTAESSSSHGDINALFFPEAGEANFKRIEEELAGSRQSIDVAMFTLTNDILVDAIIARHKAGVYVRVITATLNRNAKAAMQCDCPMPELRCVWTLQNLQCITNLQ